MGLVVLLARDPAPLLNMAHEHSRETAPLFAEDSTVHFAWSNVWSTQHLLVSVIGLEVFSQPLTKVSESVLILKVLTVNRSWRAGDERVGGPKSALESSCGCATYKRGFHYNGAVEAYRCRSSEDN